LSAEDHRKKILSVVNALSDQELEKVSEMLAQQDAEDAKELADGGNDGQA
jgi:hypothetical protein